MIGVKSTPPPSDTLRMEGPDGGYEHPMRTRDDDDLGGEVGQSLALFGMSLAVVLIGLLVGVAL